MHSLSQLKKIYKICTVLLSSDACSVLESTGKHHAHYKYFMSLACRRMVRDKSYEYELFCKNVL